MDGFFPGIACIIIILLTFNFGRFDGKQGVYENCIDYGKHTTMNGYITCKYTRNKE